MTRIARNTAPGEWSLLQVGQPVEYDAVVQVPTYDPVTGEAILSDEVETRPVLDDDGNPVLDENGDPLTEDYRAAVMQDVVERFRTSYETVAVLWSDELRREHGFDRVREPLPPEGMIEVARPEVLTDVDGVPYWTPEYALPPEMVISTEDVDRERDRRMNGGFDFDGQRYQSRAADRENILGAFSLASVAILTGQAAPGDVYWSDEVDENGEPKPFTWIAEDNSLVPMDAPTTMEFGKRAAAWKNEHTKRARAIKDMQPIPLDYEADHYWPAGESTPDPDAA